MTNYSTICFIHGNTSIDINFSDITFSYFGSPSESPVLSDINLKIDNGEFLVVLGPSGCGKSTLLSLIAGFLHPLSGVVSIGGEPIIGPGRNRGLVFQNFDSALFPWMTVKENVEFGLKIANVPREERNRRSEAVLKMVNLSRDGQKFPDRLSGGMKQRVQIARLLAVNPTVMLMDEPFASLDAQTRQVLQGQFVDIWSQMRPTVVYVTHDIREAINLGQRIVLMSAGPCSRIKREYQVPFDYPRNETSRSYLELYTLLAKDLEEEVMKGWR